MARLERQRLVLTVVFRSNCVCDQIFSDCLKKVDTFTADTLGSFYFRSNRECLTMAHPRT